MIAARMREVGLGTEATTRTEARGSQHAFDAVWKSMTRRLRPSVGKQCLKVLKKGHRFAVLWRLLYMNQTDSLVAASTTEKNIIFLRRGTLRRRSRHTDA